MGTQPRWSRYLRRTKHCRRARCSERVGRWTVRNRIGPTDAAALRNISGSLDTAFDDEHATVRGDTLVLRYRDPDFATRVAGVVRIDHFHDSTVGIGSLGADRLTVIGPEGSRVDQSLPGATVEENRMTLTTWSSGTAPFATVVPADRSALGGWIGTRAAVLLGVGRTLAVNLLIGLGIPAALLAGFLGVESTALAKVRGHRGPARYVGALLAGVGVLAVAVAFLPSSNFGSRRLLAVLGSGTAVLGTAVFGSGGRMSLDQSLAAGVGATGVAIVGGYLAAPTSAAVEVGLGAGVLFVLPVVGVARTRRERALAVGAIVAVFSFAAVVVFPFTLPTFQGSTTLYLSMGAILLAVAGLPLTLLGAALSARPTAH